MENRSDSAIALSLSLSLSSLLHLCLSIHTLPLYIQLTVHLLIYNLCLMAKWDSAPSTSLHYVTFFPFPTSSQVRSYSPQFMLTISSVDSLEAKLNKAQDDLGVPHHGRVSVTYRSKSDAGYVHACAFVYVSARVLPSIHNH